MMKEHSERESEGVELRLAVVRGEDVVEFGVGAYEICRGWERPAVPEVLGREREDREPTTRGCCEADTEATGRLGSAPTHDDDVGRADLEQKALESLGGAAARQFSEAADLPRVERGVRDGSGRRVEE